MTGFRTFFKLLLVSFGALVLILAMTGSAAAETDTYLGVAFHPFTLDGGNSTCVPWTDSHIGQTRNCDPVNLIFPGQTWEEVRTLLQSVGWSTSGLGSGQSLHYDGSGTYGEDEQLFKSDGSSQRYHIRLWEAPGSTLVTLAAVHHESGIFIHTIDMAWEQAEANVADQLCAPVCEQTGQLARQDQIQGSDSEWRGWANNGSATVIPAPAPTNTAPTASFTFDCTGLSCNFDASTSSDPDDDIVSYVWDFGDDDGDNGITTSHTYVSAGTYDVALTVTDDDTATGSQNQAVTVNDGNPSTMHVADLAGTSLNVKKNWQAQVTITVHDSVEQLVVGAEIDGYWSGDTSGAGSCTTDSWGTCTLFSASMLKKGTENAIFSVTSVSYNSLAYNAVANHDPEGDSSGTAIQVNKDGSTQDPGELPNQKPVASFSYSCDDVTLTCNFDASDAYDPDGNITSYNWDFGEGDPDSGMMSSHTFSTAGSHTVTLTVMDDVGETAQEQQTISVGQPAGTPILSASGYKVKGVQHAELIWNSIASSNVDIFRNGGLVGTVSSGASPYIDNIGQKGGGSYLYQVCEAGTANCSNQVLVDF